jgi:hypothetical protein
MPDKLLSEIRLGDPQLAEYAEQLAKRELVLQAQGLSQLDTTLLDALFAQVPKWWRAAEFAEVFDAEQMSEEFANALLAWIDSRQAPVSPQPEPAAAPSVSAPSKPERKRPFRPFEAMATLPKPTNRVELRDQLEELVRRQLIGPWAGEQEIIYETSVRGRYLVGMLAPRNSRGLPEAFDESDLTVGEGEEDNESSTPSKASTSILPSSIGLSFTVQPDCHDLCVRLRWGHYKRIPNPDTSAELKFVWQRRQIDRELRLPLVAGKISGIPIDPDFPQVLLQGAVRYKLDGWSITLFLSNQQAEPRKNVDEAWLFQPEIQVYAPDHRSVFTRRPVVGRRNDAEEQALAMLYRNQIEFAVGHSVAVEARKANNELAEAWTDRANHIRTVVMPSYEVPYASQPSAQEYPLLAELELDMLALVQIADGEFNQALTPLTRAYEQWIEQLEARIAQPSADLAPFIEEADQAINQCRQALQRIQAGIDLLDSNPQVAQAFRFANQAMADQRIRSKYIEAKRRDPKASISQFHQPQYHSWRAFQLGFILLNLPALSDPLHAERAVAAGDLSNPAENIADLLWFPTGGGKTEAYLGLTAFTLGIRRLQGIVGDHDGGAGVAVIMRYTLRLLTLQQFQRAATLICACELIRQSDPHQWGNEPFRIGLWVGQRSTPNWVDDAEESIKELRKGNPVSTGTPQQLNSCPWCGTEIKGGENLAAETAKKGRSRVFTYCGSILNNCPFNQAQADGEGLPIMVVDEEIYHRLPSLLIGTVDKFAQMPWNGRIAALFGHVSAYCERHGYLTPDSDHDVQSHPATSQLPAAKVREVLPLRPPDLIIQDELHLISGPLGTMVGLYESAIDELASWEYQGKRIRPKLVASTATIRRASQQVHSLFLRKVEVFPPQGLDAGNTFFSIQHTPSAERPGRRYLGICAHGTRQRTALIQSYVALLSVAQQLYQQANDLADPYMTLVGYFNTLRDLAAMRRVVEDSVTTRLKKMPQRGLPIRYLNPETITELTSRRNASEIPKILQRLETSFTNEQTKERVDVLLATNMISVGVDISRLGLMVVSGQPKSTAEYIQATSRVGRDSPGLVLTVYNWTRPRDLSHYERFEHYHATFYQQVEALSVTPFSPRAIDRGLTGVIMAMARLLDQEYNENLGAQKMNTQSPLIRRIQDRISQRAAIIAGKQRGDFVEQSIKQRIDEWASRIRQARSANLGYDDRRQADTVALLERPEGQINWQLLTVLNSLRDVESNVALIFDDRGLDNHNTPWNYQSKAASSVDNSADTEPDTQKVPNE